MKMYNHLSTYLSGNLDSLVVFALDLQKSFIVSLISLTYLQSP